MTGCEHVSEAAGLPAPLYAIPADPRFHAGRPPQASAARVDAKQPGAPIEPEHRSIRSGASRQPAEWVHGEPITEEACRDAMR